MAAPAVSIICLGACLTLSAALPVTGAALGAPETGQAAVLFNPSATPSQLALAAASAGVEIVRFGGAPGTLIVHIDQPGGHDALRRAGAWLIADPVILGGCAVQPIKESRS
ncbi:hypothetical protein F1654_10630 [Alkalicaulis satelles]|uniref:Uncharacterized protein n=1 Tax=Alkalicaulis satelles TaxID=2609175 RepID=A0A5M6ZEU7_9PROT|nr:hypothetical protein [Alkalicaulis satelles]KAA5802277.1 hypothetical protein F1654_10630 [Alkalicaulis satelles]